VGASTMTVITKTIDPEANVTKLAFGEDLSIYVIQEVKHQLDAVLNDGYMVDVDLSKVEEFDSAGLQLLVMLKRHLLANKLNFKVLVVSDTVQKLLDTYHLSDQLDAKDLV
jgi:anti-anti-sigma factor